MSDDNETNSLLREIRDLLSEASARESKWMEEMREGQAEYTRRSRSSMIMLRIGVVLILLLLVVGLTRMSIHDRQDVDVAPTGHPAESR